MKAPTQPGTVHGRLTRSSVQIFEDINMHDIKPTIDDYANVDANTTEISIRSTPSSEEIVQDALETITQEPRVLLQAINELQRFGIDTTVPLPRIVVVGDQSAGKSSLIEAISEIKVPRDSGTCTRCVIQINLRASEGPTAPWICNVSLVKRYSYDPESDPISVLFPWVDNPVPTTTAFGTVHDKDNLESLIRLAQIATLNPQKRPESFIGTEYTDHSTGVAFAPNIVALDIVAVNAPNLSFYDLPGVISQTRDGRNDTINLVSNLVRDYCSKENTLVLLAIPFESDIDNSKTSQLLNEVGANERTIGVLTKPDRLQSDDRLETWMDVLHGKAFAKGHGYFAVKQPSQLELKNGISHAEARELEKDFFESEFWTSRFPGFDERLGTTRLQQFLSTQLASMILNSLPDITAKVGIRLSEIKGELQKLPDPPPNALHVVNKVLNTFNSRLRARLDGEEQPNDLSLAWKEIRKSFFDEITESQRPVLIVSERSSPAIPKLETSKKALSPRPIPKFATPKKRRTDDIESIVVQDSDEEMQVPTPTKQRIMATPRSRVPQPQPQPSVLKKQLFLRGLHATLENYSSSGLPDVVEPKAVKALILSTLENWDRPLDQLLVALRDTLGTAMLQTLSETVSEWRTTGLFGEMKKIIAIFLELQVGELESNFAARALRIERSKPMTLDGETLKRYQEEELQLFMNARFKERSERYFDDVDEKSGKETSKKDRERTRSTNEAEFQRKLGPDPFKREVEVMARIRAYYKIASTRFVDTICQAVEAELFVKFRDGLHDELVEGLHVVQSDCHEYATKLLDDDPARAERRLLLKKQMAGLEQATDRLAQLV